MLPGSPLWSITYCLVFSIILLFIYEFSSYKTLSYSKVGIAVFLWFLPDTRQRHRHHATSSSPLSWGSLQKGPSCWGHESFIPEGEPGWHIRIPAIILKTWVGIITIGCRATPSHTWAEISYRSLCDSFGCRFSREVDRTTFEGWPLSIISPWVNSRWEASWDKQLLAYWIGMWILTKHGYLLEQAHSIAGPRHSTDDSLSQGEPKRSWRRSQSWLHNLIENKTKIMRSSLKK